MNIVVVGTGNIGTLYGWAFAAAGHEVTHLVRSAAGRAPEARLDVLDERPRRDVRRQERYAWTVAEQPPAQADLVFAALPAARLPEAVPPLAARYPEATILTWALEWDPVDLADVDPERLVIGYPDSGGTRAGSDYVLSLGAEPHLGLRRSGGSPHRLEAVVGLFRSAGFAPVLHEPFQDWLRVHCALTVPFWIALAGGPDLEAFVHERARLRAAFAASKEMLKLLEAEGVDVAGNDPTNTAAVPVWLFPFVFQVLYRTNEGMRRASAHSVAGIGEGIDLTKQVLAGHEHQLPELRRLAAGHLVQSRPS